MYKLYKELYAKYKDNIHENLQVVYIYPRTLNLYEDGRFIGRYDSAFNCITAMLVRSAA